jgi:hypothetical protein
MPQPPIGRALDTLGSSRDVIYMPELVRARRASQECNKRAPYGREGTRAPSAAQRGRALRPHAGAASAPTRLHGRASDPRRAAASASSGSAPGTPCACRCTLGGEGGGEGGGRRRGRIRTFRASQKTAIYPPRRGPVRPTRQGGSGRLLSTSSQLTG